MGIFLGLVTALSWGGSDFISRFVSRKLGALRAVFYMQAWGFLLLSVALFFLRGQNHLFDGSGWRPWAWGILAGTINTFAMLALYQAFTVGKLTIVAPVSASYPALTVLLSFLSGENLSILRYIGIAVTILGVVFVARGEGAPSMHPDERPSSPRDGLFWALVAAFGFGLLFWLLGIHIIPATGPFAAVWLIRVTGALISMAILFFRRSPARPVGKSTTLQTAGMGFLDTGAFLFSNRGMQLEQISVVSVLGSLYGAVTVGLATLFLRERVGRLQWCGIVLIFGGIFFLSR
ncbi:MAG TPA: DMT family transporter [Candidatus Acidoferrum sp.]|nr:DMT family transporter [Candidatus Acidoferrum sp.]